MEHLRERPAEPGLGVLCAEAQADGVPCAERVADCEDCERAVPNPPPARARSEGAAKA